jgi:hypothetical protein
VRLTQVSDFAASVARIIDLQTGLVIGKTIVQEHGVQLDREIDLETGHDTFFRLLGEVVGKEEIEQLQESFDPRKVASVGQTIVLVSHLVLHEDEEPDIIHWQQCPAHQRLLREVFGFYLDCVLGKAKRPPKIIQRAVALRRQLESGEPPSQMANWGKLLTSWENVMTLARALETYPQGERDDVLIRLFSLITTQPSKPDHEAFRALVKSLTKTKTKTASN